MSSTDRQIRVQDLVPFDEKVDAARHIVPQNKGNGAGPFSEDQAIVVVDRRRLLSQCLLASLRLADPTTVFRSYTTVGEWQGDAEFAPASLILLCVAGVQTHETDAALRRELSQLRAVCPEIPVTIMSDCESPGRIMEALECGVRGYLPTSTSLEVALHALHLVRAGGVYVPASVLSALARSDPNAQPDPASKGVDLFSPRQLRVARALRKGTPNKIIAYELNMCESTVKVHVRTIMKKLNAKNRTEVAFLTNGLFEAEDYGSVSPYAEQRC